MLNELETCSESVMVWVDGYNKRLRRKFTNNISLKNSFFLFINRNILDFYWARQNFNKHSEKLVCSFVYSIVLINVGTFIGWPVFIRFWTLSVTLPKTPIRFLSERQIISIICENAKMSTLAILRINHTLVWDNTLLSVEAWLIYTWPVYQGYWTENFCCQFSV